MGHTPVWDEDKLRLVHSAAISDPSGGVTVDVEARAVITLILQALRNASLIAED